MSYTPPESVYSCHHSAHFGRVRLLFPEWPDCQSDAKLQQGFSLTCTFRVGTQKHSQDTLSEMVQHGFESASKLRVI